MLYGLHSYGQIQILRFIEPFKWCDKELGILKGVSLYKRAWYRYRKVKLNMGHGLLPKTPNEVGPIGQTSRAARPNRPGN